MRVAGRRGFSAPGRPNFLSSQSLFYFLHRLPGLVRAFATRRPVQQSVSFSASECFLFTRLPLFFFPDDSVGTSLPPRLTTGPIQVRCGPTRTTPLELCPPHTLPALFVRPPSSIADFLFLLPAQTAFTVYMFFSPCQCPSPYSPARLGCSSSNYFPFRRSPPPLLRPSPFFVFFFFPLIPTAPTFGKIFERISSAGVERSVDFPWSDSPEQTFPGYHSLLLDHVFFATPSPSVLPAPSSASDDKARHVSSVAPGVH